MATWKSENSILTQVGVEILNKIKSGVGSITITRIVAGSGRVSDSQLFQQTSLTGDTKPMIISSKETTETGSEISFYITNEDFTESFNLNQIGVFVSHPDYEEEQLYHISQCDLVGFDVIPALNETPVNFGYSLFLEHGNSSSITLTIDPQGMVSAASLNATLTTVLSNYTRGLKSDVTYYVDSVNGNDDNVGDESRPFATIQRALNLLTTNLNGKRVKIWVKPGEYNKFELNHKYNGFIDIESFSSENKAIVKGDCRISYNTGRVKFTHLHFISDLSNTDAVLEIQTAQEVMINQCTIDAVSNTLSGICLVSSGVNLGVTGSIFRNCKHCVNTNHYSGIGGISSVSVYSCSGSNNNIGIVNSCSTISVYATTKERLGATTMYSLMPTAGPTYEEGVLVTNAVASATLE